MKAIIRTPKLRYNDSLRHSFVQPQRRYLAMASPFSIKPLPSRNPEPKHAKDHHVGNPPKSFKNPWPSFSGPTTGSLFYHRFGNAPGKDFVPVPEGPRMALDQTAW